MEANALPSMPGHQDATEHLPQSSLPELVQLLDLIDTIEDRPDVTIDVLTKVNCGGHEFPVHAIHMGCQDETSPIIAFIGGVHGLERIGSQVVISYLNTVIELLNWDHYIKTYLERARLVFIPIMNPGGMYMKTRSNPNGVDLMRNAPIEAQDISPLMLVAGHRYSSRLPWYRGKTESAMEPEAQALCDYMRKHFFNARVGVSVDVHSGFGIKDRLWFPYACSSRPFHHLAEVHALGKLLDQTYPNHVYQLEPQANTYRTHGDLWDYLYFEQRKNNPEDLFLPLTLELGSWNWVKKNPQQLLSLVGVFNPIIPHRFQRTLRRHLLLFDFLLRATIGFETWAFLDPRHNENLRKEALKKWYTY